MMFEFENSEQLSNVKNFTFESKSNDFLISIKPLFMPTHSSIEDLLFVWCYHVQIENFGNEAYKIINRHWKITDGNAKVCEVTGEGVGGEQPLLNPGDLYEYTSAVPLCTPSGFMQGYYIMEKEDGSHIELDTPTFSLDSPYAHLSIN